MHDYHERIICFSQVPQGTMLSVSFLYEGNLSTRSVSGIPRNFICNYLRGISQGREDFEVCFIWLVIVFSMVIQSLRNELAAGVFILDLSAGWVNGAVKS